jgi:acyl-CoA oxidase
MDRALDRIKTTLAHMLCEEYSSILETSDCASAIKFDRSPSFDIAEMTKLLDHDNHTLRTALRDLLKDEVFVHQWDISLEQQRELTISRLRKILSFTFNGEPLLSVKHFRTNPLRIFAVHEIVAQADISAAILLAVQFK